MSIQPYAQSQQSPYVGAQAATATTQTELQSLCATTEDLASALHNTADRIEQALDRISGSRPKDVAPDKVGGPPSPILLSQLRTKLDWANDARSRLIALADRLDSIG